MNDGGPIDEMVAKQKAEIKAANVPTEAQMRDTKVPTHDRIEQLGEYISSLVDRPHDYGTCVYAMSMAATAAFQYVARKLAVTGFQASCADMDILRRTRGWEWGTILNFEDLLYPQYRYKFHTWDELIEQNKEELAKRAKALIAKEREAHPNVVAHWKRLANAS